jgi:hypothetical protein
MRPASRQDPLTRLGQRPRTSPYMTTNIRQHASRSQWYTTTVNYTLYNTEEQSKNLESAWSSSLMSETNTFNAPSWLVYCIQTTRFRTNTTFSQRCNKKIDTMFLNSLLLIQARLSETMTSQLLLGEQMSRERYVFPSTGLFDSGYVMTLVSDWSCTGQPGGLIDTL